MKEHPILFSAPMVRALLEGRKTQTRRVVRAPKWSAPEKALVDFECPYGWTGDMLVLLSTWATLPEHDTVKPSLLSNKVRIWSRWDGEKPHGFGKNRPGRFMPLWMRDRMPIAVLTAVRVERVQEITEHDAVAEGCVASVATPTEWWVGYRRDCLDRYGNMAHTHVRRMGGAPAPAWMDEPRIHKGEDGLNIPAKRSYESLWRNLHTEEGHRWEDNPWVWVLEFKRV